MAAIARRTLAQIETEVKLRIGNPNNTTINTQHYVWAAMLRLALTYHHFELDKTDATLTLSTSVNTLALPADCFIAIHFQVLNTAGTAVVTDTEEYDFSALTREYSPTTPAAPTKRARFGSTLYFNKLPDQAYKGRLYYYSRPAAPDFAGTDTSPLDVEIDEHIIEQAVLLASAGTSAPLVELNRQLLDDWIGLQVRSSLLDPISAKRTRRTTERTLGGVQG